MVPLLCAAPVGCAASCSAAVGLKPAGSHVERIRGRRGRLVAAQTTTFLTVDQPEMLIIHVNANYFTRKEANRRLIRTV